MSKVKKEDKFRTKESWITRVTVNPPHEIREEDILCKLTGTKSGKVVITPIFPDSDHQELYQLEGILIEKDEPQVRTINTKRTKIAGVAVKVIGKGKIIEYLSVSEEGANNNYKLLEDYFTSKGTEIIDEFTVKCGKGVCLLKHKKQRRQDAIDL